MARKDKKAYVCQECGYDSPGYLGKCPECNAWNSFKEIKLSLTTTESIGRPKVQPVSISKVKTTKEFRIDTGIAEFNNVLGGGIVRGSVMLLAGDPGVGKSTLLLKLSMNLSNKNKILYVCGEESAQQIKLRADRMQEGESAKTYDLENIVLYPSVNVDEVETQVDNIKPDLIVVDSIQTMESENTGGMSGSVPQIRYAAMTLIRIAKRLDIPVILIGHVTKEGNIAGPMLLSHMVDVVLFFEGEKLSDLRIARAFKNRFGPIDEVGVFRMSANGLNELSDPTEFFVDKKREESIGCMLTVTMEGRRAFLIEIQALAVSSRLPMPQRVVSGIDRKRVELLLAVMKKYTGLNTDNHDVFVSIAGGIKLNDPGVDLAICMALYSSMKLVSFENTISIGEVGLLGELRDVYSQDKRIKEAKKFGYKNVISPEGFKNLSSIFSKYKNDVKKK